MSTTRSRGRSLRPGDAKAGSERLGTLGHRPTRERDRVMIAGLLLRESAHPRIVNVSGGAGSHGDDQFGLTRPRRRRRELRHVRKERRG